MVKSLPSCERLGTCKKKTWLYDEYYIGHKDQEDRRDGEGENHWTGAESLEWYLGNFTRDTMHGVGEYRWRYLGTNGASVTYEGHMYCNRMHGYGTMSYDDGKLFQGIYNTNVRWGPGVESRMYSSQNVGFWWGQRIIRLSWKPATPSIAPDLCLTAAGRAYVEEFRTMLAASRHSIGDVNCAIELLKRHGADPRVAITNWKKLYPRNCTDLDSAMCHNEAFEHDYYKKDIQTLEEVTDINYHEDEKQNELEDPKISTFYAWNNNKLMIRMMMHCFKHDKQNNATKVNLSHILSGPRKGFRTPGKHETYCRTLLMASYLGHMSVVTRLTNRNNVYPDVCDVQGNNTVMYAAVSDFYTTVVQPEVVNITSDDDHPSCLIKYECGDQTDAIKFLVDAGANVDSYNDSCCTPLAVALIRFLCAKNDVVTPNSILEALLPPPEPAKSAVLDKTAEEWKITRDSLNMIPTATMTKTPSKILKVSSAKKLPKSSSLLNQTKKKTDPVENDVVGSDSNMSISEEQKKYVKVNNEFMIRLEDLFTLPIGAPANTPHLFTINDMIKETEAVGNEVQKDTDKNIKKDVFKKGLEVEKRLSKNRFYKSQEEITSLTSAEKLKLNRLAQMEDTVKQLLANGANPNLVKCPQSALFIAVVSGSSNLVRHLCYYGANVNEEYPQAMGYTPIDLAVSRPFTVENLHVIKTLLECGASPCHVLHKASDESVPTAPNSTMMEPTLLHAVLARPVEADSEEEISRLILQLLLEYNCDSTVLYKGQSAIDIALSKGINKLDIFIKSSKTNLNAVINSNNQTILVKMFSMPFFKTFERNEQRFHILTNLLLYGADPLKPSQNGDDKYQNLFQFTNKILTEMKGPIRVSPTGTSKVDTGKATKLETSKPTKVDTNKASNKTSAAKSNPNKLFDDIDNYNEAVTLITECGRIVHVRWLQAKLVKELVEVVSKFRYRQWNMIVKEHKQNRKATGLWVTPQRCLEIFDILSTTKKKIYSDKRVLKHLLCIVQFYNTNWQDFRDLRVTAEEKNLIDEQMYRLLKEHRLTETINVEVALMKRSYVMPELVHSTDEKFNVCFDCSLPIDNSPAVIKCKSCRLVSFCDMECLRNNVESSYCHPCNSYIKSRYFPDSEADETVHSSPPKTV